MVATISYGQKLDTEKTTIGVDKSQINSSQICRYHLYSWSSICPITGQKLFLMLDEAENLGRLQNKSASSTYESIRYLLDQEHISMAFAIGAETPDQVPAIFTNADIIRRMQVDNVKTLPAGRC